MLKVAMLSKWHVHADGYANFVKAQPDACITCVWDEDAERGAKWAAELGVPFEACLKTLLKRDDVDAVLVDTPTSMHKEVMIAAANAKKHIFTEKAMAATVADCNAIAKAVADNGVKFVISFPGLTGSAMQYIKSAIDEGKLGKVTYLRIRAAHGGSCQGWLPEYWYDVNTACGGAMMDLGCHPNYQASYLLGTPKRIASMFTTLCCPETVEDNAVSTVEFEGGAIAVLETGFVSPWSPSAIEVLGTEGSIYAKGDKLKIHSKSTGIDGWITPDTLPKPRPMAIRQWIDAILYGGEIMFDTTAGTKLTQLLENEYISHKTQTIVSL